MENLDPEKKGKSTLVERFLDLAIGIVIFFMVLYRSSKCNRLAC